MSIFGKLMFWKKHDELGLDSMGINSGEAPILPEAAPQQNWSQPVSPYSQQQPSSFFPQQSSPQIDAFQSSGSYAQSKQLEVISAKLDALKAAIDSLNQRLANIERIQQGDDYFRKRGW